MRAGPASDIGCQLRQSSAAAPEPRIDHKWDFTPKQCCRIWNLHTRLLLARRINLSCSRKIKLVDLAIRQCAGNRRGSGREAEAVKYLSNRLGMNRAENASADASVSCYFGRRKERQDRDTVISLLPTNEAMVAETLLWHCRRASRILPQNAPALLQVRSQAPRPLEPMLLCRSQGAFPGNRRGPPGTPRHDRIPAILWRQSHPLP